MLPVGLTMLTHAIFTTPRLEGRRPDAADGPGVRALLLHPEVQVWLRPAPLPAFEARDADTLLQTDQEHWVRHGFGPLSLRDRVTGEYVGRGGLARATVLGRPAVELPWAVVPARHNEGLATEAARAAIEWAWDLDLPEVVSFALKGNAASRRVMDKAGLTFDRDLKRAGLPHVLYRATRPR